MTDIVTRAIQAAQNYLDLQARRTHPVGAFDNVGRWWPDTVVEQLDCCHGLARPNRNHRYRLLMHCRTRRHVMTAWGLEIRDVEQLQAVKAAELLLTQTGSAGAESLAALVSRAEALRSAA